jgi:hypothetical protein
MKNPLKLIGLHGEPGCGKDTIAEFLADNYEFKRISLADPLRKGISAMFQLPPEYLTDRDLKEKPMDRLCGKSPRQVMQTLGTEWGRKTLCNDIWLKIAQLEIDYNQKLANANNYYIKGVVISDIRFEGEAKWLRDQGGIIWHIYRPENPYAIKTDHESEQGITVNVDDDILVVNDSSIEDLQNFASLIIEQME